MNVIHILKAHLSENGFGGLFAPNAECGCELIDLVPCDSNCCQCEPGYKHFDPRPERAGDWSIWKQKEPPTIEQWDGMEY